MTKEIILPDKTAIPTPMRTKRIPAVSLVLTGKSFFILNRKEVDVEKLNIGVGDIVIYCIRREANKDAGYTHRQIRGLVYDGVKLRQIHLWTFEKGSHLNNLDKLSVTVDRLSRAIFKNYGCKVLYDRSGYSLAMSKCYRCGHCCIECGVTIVRPEFLKYYSYTHHKDEMVVFKNANVPCPHLAWDNGNKTICKVHHYEWFRYTPCCKHKSNDSCIQCTWWKLAEKEGDQWYMKYYQGYRLEEYDNKFYELNESAIDHLFIVDQQGNLTRQPYPNR